MAFTLDDHEHLQRLRRAMEASRRKLEPFRRRHREAVEQFVGVYYSDDGSDRPVHVNLMELAANIYERQLIARPPKVTVFTRNAQFGPVGRKLEVVINDLLKRFDVHAALTRAVRSGLFSMGIVKVGTRVTDKVYIDNYEIDRVEPFVKQILLDDWVHDMTARSWEEVSYLGHRYRVPLEEAIDNPEFKKSVREDLWGTDFDAYNEGGDARIHTLSQGVSMHETEYEKKVELWEIYLPRLKQVVTLSSLEDQPPLRVVEWEGPERGPFHVLSFQEVDGQTMPLAPASQWRGLHEIVNGLYRKLERQSQRMKVISVARGEDSEDAEILRNASDGEVVGVNNPDAIQEKRLGGIDQQNFGFMLQSKELFNWLAGNLDSLGGLGPSSETVGQDAMLAASNSRRLSAMQDQVLLFSKNVLTDFGFWAWSDPLETYQAILEEQGFDTIVDTLKPDERESHSFYHHEIEVKPYSMTFQSPSERLSIINQVVQGIILPAMPLVREQGMVFDLAKLLETYARYADLPELMEIVHPAQPLPGDTAPPVLPPDAPASEREQGPGPPTHTVNERISRPGATRRGAEQTMVQQLMGGNPQQSEQAAMARQMGGL
jgi:hypothetical protein